MKRTIAWLLSVIMIIGMLPMSTLAAEDVDRAQNLRLVLQAQLYAVWEDPAQNGYFDITIWYNPDGSPNGWKQIDSETEWEKESVYNVQMAQFYGEGWYKFAVSYANQNNWVESEPLYLNLEGTETYGRIQAPTSGSFASGILNWEDPADVDPEYWSYGHKAIVEMWYTGEEGQLPRDQWEFIDDFHADDNTADLGCFGGLADLNAGQYAFTVRNFAEDYGWRGQSESILLDGRYTHTGVSKLDAPNNLHWTEDGGVYWDFPTDASNVDEAIFELMVTDEELTDVEAEWDNIQRYTFYVCNIGAEGWDEAMENHSANIEKDREVNGAGWYYFRVRYIPVSNVLNKESDWAYSAGRYFAGEERPGVTEICDLQWNVIHQPVGSKDAPGYISFRIPENALYDVNFYQSGSSYSLGGFYGRAWDCDYVSLTFSDRVGNWQNGTYYFTVQLKDENGMDVGNPVRSSDWVFTRPTKVLNATDLTWNIDDMCLEWQAEDDLVGWVSVDIYFNATSDDPESAQYIRSGGYGAVSSIDIDTSMFEYGEGWYYFCIQLGTNNPLEALNGQRSDYSVPFHFTGADRKLQIAEPGWTGNGTEMTWTISAQDKALVKYYEVTYYYNTVNDEQTATAIGSDNFWSDSKWAMSSKMLEKFGTGYYFYTVRAVTNNPVEASDSEVSLISGSLRFNQPECKLNMYNTGWTEDGKMTWEVYDDFDYSLVECYDVRFYYGDTEADVDTAWPVRYATYTSVEDIAVPADMVEQYGDGWYAFSICAVSKNIFAAQTGAWSSVGEAMYFGKTSEPIKLTAIDLSWGDDGEVLFKLEKGSVDMVGRYTVQLWYSEDEDLDNGQKVGNYDYTSKDDGFILPSSAFEKKGAGYYWFRVCIYSCDTSKAQDGDWSSYVDEPLYVGSSQQAVLAPTDLQWGVERDEDETETKPGVLSFKNPYFDGYKTDAEFRIEVYRKDATGDVMVADTDQGTNCPYINFNIFERSRQPVVSGDYYFIAYTVAHGNEREESAVVTSDTWTYIRPEAELTVSAPVWGQGMTMYWQDGTYTPDYYRIHIQHVDENDSFYPGNYDGTMTVDQMGKVVSEKLLKQCGEGSYYFQVQACSNDPTVITNSAWSEWSDAFEYTGELPEPEPDENALAPTDLKWDTKEGTLSFKNPYYDGDTDSEFRVEVYRRDAEGKVENIAGSDSGTNREKVSFAPFENDPDKLLTGEYYFTVYTVAENGHGQSAKATSPVWNYTRPEAQLEVSDPVWTDDMLMSWTNGTILGGHYKIRYQFVPAGGTFDAHDYNGSLTTRETGNVAVLEKWLTKNGTGTYYFCVMALSDDLNEIVHSDWSGWSEGYYYDAANPPQQPEQPEQPEQPVAAVKAPVELYWNKTTAWAPDTTGNYNQILIDLTGSIAFKRATNADSSYADLGEYYIEFYNVETGKCVIDGGIGIGRDSAEPYVENPNFIFDDMPSGKYYFRVCAIDANGNRSEWVTSDTWTYTKPTVKLGVADGLHWVNRGNKIEAAWNSVTGAGRYQVHFYFAKDEKSQLQSVNISRVSDASSFKELRDQYLNKYGKGLWYFQVQAVPGDITEYASGTWSAMSAAYDTRTGGETPDTLPKLGTPTELQWHKELTWVYENGERHQELTDRVGSIAFKRPVDENGNFLDQGEYDILLIDANTGAVLDEHGWGFGSNSTNTYFDMGYFINQDIPSGTYQIKIRAEGDGINYGDGDWVITEPWTYVKPAEKLETPEIIGWNDKDYTNREGKTQITALWEASTDAFNYEIRYLFAKDENSKPDVFSISHEITPSGGVLRDFLDEYSLAYKGEGLYFFQVRAVPHDITQIDKSEWSAMSAAYDFRAKVEDVHNQLNDLVGKDAEQIQETLSEIELLGQAMAADAAKGESGTMDKLAQLEDTIKETYKVETEIAVSDTLKDRFDGVVPEITAANMALNVDLDAAGEAEGTQVTLNVSDAKGEVVLPDTLLNTQKNNTMVFSMKLENAKDADPNTDSTELLVPVQITLPIPADINRSFLVVLHQKADGTWEELTMPHVFEKNGQWYATFNVTSFSNFAIGERTMTAEKQGNAVVLEAHLPSGGKETKYLCSVYSADGQMLGMAMLDPWAEEALEIQLEQAVPAGAYVKIFAADTGAGWTLPSDAIEVAIQ